MIGFTVYGTAIPQGSKTPYVRNGRAILVDSNPRLKGWRELVTWEAKAARRGAQALTGAVGVGLDFHMPRPKTVTRERPSVVPDVDKLVRAIFDGITDSGLWLDDSQVVSLRTDEWYADKPRVEIAVWLLEGNTE